MPGFLSTFPLRGTSGRRDLNPHEPAYFYPRSPCGERRAAAGQRRPDIQDFYPRSPCGERPTCPCLSREAIEFLSTFPLRGTSRLHGGNVSGSSTFLSTFPLRGTSRQCWITEAKTGFLSTFPLRGTSKRSLRVSWGLGISIHVPLAGNVCWCPQSGRQ